MARGCRYLAAVWEGAWIAGDEGKKIKSTAKVKQADLIKLYRNPKNLPSMHLDTIGPLLKETK
jgi:hypothetical protein